MIGLLRLLKNRLSDTIFVGRRFLREDIGYFPNGHLERPRLESLWMTFSNLALLEKKLENFIHELGIDDRQSVSTFIRELIHMTSGRLC